MNNILKQFLLAICIGIIVAILFDSYRPEYKYFTSSYRNKEISKEVYTEKAKSKYSDGVVKYKKINLYAWLLGITTTISLVLINPLNRQFKK
jgi:hypothetical protein